MPLKLKFQKQTNTIPIPARAIREQVDIAYPLRQVGANSPAYRNNCANAIEIQTTITRARSLSKLHTSVHLQGIRLNKKQAEEARREMDSVSFRPKNVMKMARRTYAIASLSPVK